MKKLEGVQTSNDGKITTGGVRLEKVRNNPFIRESEVERLANMEERMKVLRYKLLEFIQSPDNAGLDEEQLLKSALNDSDLRELGERKLRMAIGVMKSIDE